MQVWQLQEPFPTVSSLSELSFRFRFILLVQTKKVISMNYDSSKSTWKPWRHVRLDLILVMRSIHIHSNLNLLIKFTSSSRNTEFKDILSWSISKLSWRPTQPKNSHKLCNETGHPILSFTGSQWKLRQQHDSSFPMEGKPL